MTDRRLIDYIESLIRYSARELLGPAAPKRPVLGGMAERYASDPLTEEPIVCDLQGGMFVPTAVMGADGLVHFPVVPLWHYSAGAYWPATPENQIRNVSGIETYADIVRPPSMFTGFIREYVQCLVDRGDEVELSPVWKKSHGFIKSPPDGAGLWKIWLIEIGELGVYAKQIPINYDSQYQIDRPLADHELLHDCCEPGLWNVDQKTSDPSFPQIDKTFDLAAAYAAADASVHQLLDQAAMAPVYTDCAFVCEYTGWAFNYTAGDASEAQLVSWREHIPGQALEGLDGVRHRITFAFATQTSVPTATPPAEIESGWFAPGDNLAALYVGDKSDTAKKDWIDPVKVGAQDGLNCPVRVWFSTTGQARVLRITYNANDAAGSRRDFVEVDQGHEQVILGDTCITPPSPHTDSHVEVMAPGGSLDARWLVDGLGAGDWHGWGDAEVAFTGGAYSKENNILGSVYLADPKPNDDCVSGEGHKSTIGQNYNRYLANVGNSATDVVRAAILPDREAEGVYIVSMVAADDSAIEHRQDAFGQGISFSQSYIFCPQDPPGCAWQVGVANDPTCAYDIGVDVCRAASFPPYQGGTSGRYDYVDGLPYMPGAGWQTGSPHKDHHAYVIGIAGDEVLQSPKIPGTWSGESFAPDAGFELYGRFLTFLNIPADPGEDPFYSRSCDCQHALSSGVAYAMMSDDDSAYLVAGVRGHPPGSVLVAIDRPVLFTGRV